MYDEMQYMHEDEALGAADERRWARQNEDHADVDPKSIAGIVRTSVCPECDGSGADSGALFEPEACPLCQGAGTLAPDELVDTLFFDDDNQAWVLDGLYIGCAHRLDGCGCYGRAHAGETYVGRAA